MRLLEEFLNPWEQGKKYRQGPIETSTFSDEKGERELAAGRVRFKKEDEEDEGEEGEEEEYVPERRNRVGNEGCFF